ncbi:MAG TPA: HypC/HybG/HupF family hydrogenase formation chaperone [Acidimicrobiales bacterium]|nr:HypC/HybG/HupF family hydrogenase formation chaperone [Acidimicrobiales bacterium]
MCLGIPGQIVDVGAARPDQATIDVGGVRREVDVSLLADAPGAAGEWGLVHVGFALARIDEAEAARELARLRHAGELALDAEPEAGG